MKKTNLHNYAVFRWFLLIFTTISLIFCCSLVPLFAYLQSSYSELQMEKVRQQLNAGITQLDSTVTGILNTSVVLSSDPRFVVLRYTDPDYASVPVSVRNQTRATFAGLMYPLDLIKFSALQMQQNVVITPTVNFFEDYLVYYPAFFCADELSYEEWEKLLAQTGSGFLPDIYHIRESKREYDALIYTTKWTRSSYIYACIDIEDIRELFLTGSKYSGYYLTISDDVGNILFSDLPQEADVHALESKLMTGGLHVAIHMDGAVFYEKMQPLYVFLGIYSVVCLTLLLFVIVTGSHISSKPILSIIRILEHSRNIPIADNLQQDNQEEPQNADEEKITSQRHLIFNLHNDFQYITERIRSADHMLERYQGTVSTQQKILQARFMEKAVNGQLVSSRDVALFQAYFPDFPDKYLLVLFRLQAVGSSGTIYADALLLLQSFLEQTLPNVYLQQFSDSELLLLSSWDNYEKYNQTLNLVVNNINNEESAYQARCVASRWCCHLEDLPLAYRQVQDMIELDFPYSDQRVCTTADCVERDFARQQISAFTMTDLLTLYNAITYGNAQLAVEKLQACSKDLNLANNATLNRHVYEMICAILTCIKLEHPLLLMDLHIPPYNGGKNPQEDNNLYVQLEELVHSCSSLINQNQAGDTGTLFSDLLAYIDKHYTDDDLCLTVLETEFRCSSSTIRKVFKNAANTTVSHYIEQKRMNLANELLKQKGKSISEVALECGYTNPNSFYKAYRRVYGHAPTQAAEQ